MNRTGMDPGFPSGESRVPRLLVGFAAVLAAMLAVETALRAVGWVDWATGAPLAFSGEYLVGVATTLPFVVGIGYAGYRLPRSRLATARYPRILRWVLVGTGGSLLFNLALVAVVGVSSVGMFVAWMRWGAAVGGGLGLVVGVSEARAVQSSVETARAEFRADNAASQRDFLEYLNNYLRHEVLNATQIIAGNAEQLVEEYGDGTPARSRGETIYRRSQDVTSVIQNVRQLLNATREDVSLEPVDAAAVLADRVEACEDRHEDATVDATLPGSAPVRADPLLERVFGNLLSNAVEHTDGPATVRVQMDVSAETVSVTVADDGPGIPSDLVPTLFDRPDSFAADHGMGLYLTDKIVRQYGGTVELVETGDDGSVFAVHLPRAPSDPDASGGSAGPGDSTDPAHPRAPPDADDSPPSPASRTDAGADDRPTPE